jgi:hypothetical protein
MVFGVPVVRVNTALSAAANVVWTRMAYETAYPQALVWVARLAVIVLAES